MTNNILKSIIQNKEKELKLFNSNWNLFFNTFAKKNASVIAEIKIASPSFDYRNKININSLVKYYWTNKSIKWISILIDEKFFAWDIGRIKLLKQYNKPTFFKEFVINEKQIDWACYFWYDWLLLIKRILTLKRLDELLEYTLGKWIFPIIEIDNEKDLIEELKRKWNNFWISLNARNLDTMEMNNNFHFEMYEKYKKEFDKKIVFAFSWISGLNQVDLYKWKYNWVLIWTGLIKNLKNTYE